MSDSISRQAAIDAIDKYIGKFDCIDVNFLDGLKTTKKILNDLPSAERRGSWVGIDDEPCDVWECDRCGHIVERECPPRFCPNCGAKMEVLKYE